MAAGTRTFRLDNHGSEPVEVTLRNVVTGGSVSGTAAPGRSTWEVPAGDGPNTTEVVANDQVVATSDSTNLVCGALHGHAECSPANGTTTITRTVSNNDGSPAIVLSDSRGVDFPSFTRISNPFAGLRRGLPGRLDLGVCLGYYIFFDVVLDDPQEFGRAHLGCLADST